MIPSVCELCGKPYNDEIPPNEGEYVKFADYRPAVPYTLIEADGWRYFCAEHLVIAKSVASRSLQEAIAELKNRFGPFSEYQREPRPRWLKRIFSLGKHS